MDANRKPRTGWRRFSADVVVTAGGEAEKEEELDLTAVVVVVEGEDEVVAGEETKRGEDEELVTRGTEDDLVELVCGWEEVVDDAPAVDVVAAA